MMANRKIVLQAEDVQLKNQDERKGFVNSVLLGALLGLFLKWSAIFFILFFLLFSD